MFGPNGRNVWSVFEVAVIFDQFVRPKSTQLQQSSELASNESSKDGDSN